MEENKISEKEHTINENYRQKPKVAVYVCHCGGNISDVVDVKKVAEELSKYHDVAISREYAFMCSSTGQDYIVEDIQKNGINRVVIAACSPALHELTFRGALQRAGLNPYLYEHVNIREQVSWVHKNDKEGATKKAISLVKAGVEKVLRQDPLNSIRVEAVKTVAVIGGGISGMRAALSAASNGLNAVIIEKSDKLGGKLNRSGNIYPTGEKAIGVAENLTKKVLSSDRIKVYFNSEITFVSGYVGNFQINLKKKSGEYEKIKAGAIIIATGFDNYKPYEGEYGYGLNKFVLTLPQFIEALEKSGSSKFIYEGKEINSVTFIHCVGSRQIDGIDKPGKNGKINDYCSRVCCTAIIHAANNLKNKYPDTEVFDIYTDIRTYGMDHESYYKEASKNDVIFFRRPLEERPSVEFEGGKIKIKTKDVLTMNEDMEIETDMIVLGVGMVPNDISDLVEYMKLPRSADGFLQEVHPKLRPVEVANNGIFIAGTAQGPMDVIESLQASNTAAVKSASLLASGDIPLEPFVAVVDEDKCTGCEKCPKECSYAGALTMIEKEVGGKKKKVAYVNAALCKGCGACVAVCEPKAINVAGWSLEQFEAMVEAIAKE
ncbi:MAG TPA: CoB--CoM heterodisulfide reductase iron-sulfur subunit A family protein [Elusimicrobiales bacterium]|nr:CoB--CoM heterodisulfide reductase iron-sulfur subunit A family protein [Elusimicrobiales bacterium]HOL63179.1 CoB--CoM heterodisulfide reductase iron-sulfur subunit A family protein [Elusimicrobiales bacterium]HPO96137.1 CoB--CoM heterodisulfide reductase iron-sulfur subunit A family protein [Elusimicrobiales bacterium]